MDKFIRKKLDNFKKDMRIDYKNPPSILTRRQMFLCKTKAKINIVKNEIQLWLMKFNCWLFMGVPFSHWKE